MENSTIVKGVAFGALAIAAFVCLSGVAGGGGDLIYRPMKAGNEALTRDDIEYLQTDAPAPSSADGTVTAADWQETYPYIVTTMGEMSKNEYTVDYLEESPYLVNIYEGYGFAKDYKSARGHSYTLEDVAKTERPHALANCLTCKTPNLARMVQEQGESVYSMDFDEVYSKMEETVSCYTCHGNNPGNAGALEVTHTYISDRLGDNMASVDPAVLSCGQCHIEYYFKPDNKATSVAYTSLEEMTPSAILEYYDSIGFSDWTQESTGTNLLKAQHPEMETFLQGKHGSLLNCADCHMALVQAEDGTVYHSHNFESPLENETLLATCTQCHYDKNMTAYVREIQDEITARETEVGEELSAFKDALAAAVAEGKLPEEELEKLRKLHREAQWYFDYCYVENSEGAHNSSLAKECLNTAELKVKEGMAILA